LLRLRNESGYTMTNKPHQTNVPARCIVSPDSFFSTNAEKTKLNWFLFEYAQEIESTIRRTKQLKKLLLRKGVGDSHIADFCVHYSKHMKGQILDKFAGRIPNVEIGYEEIEVCFPEIGNRLVNQVLMVVAKAWDSQTKMCVTCPTRCISERNERAPMFDEAYYWE
jgi:hypothetical protein